MTHNINSDKNSERSEEFFPFVLQADTFTVLKDVGSTLQTRPVAICF